MRLPGHVCVCVCVCVCVWQGTLCIVTCWQYFSILLAVFLHVWSNDSEVPETLSKGLQSQNYFHNGTRMQFSLIIHPLMSVFPQGYVMNPQL
jgi:hypothetical protein